MRAVTGLGVAAFRRARQWICGLPSPVILALGWILFILYAFPGLMSMDSFDQLAEGRAWFFTDSHPPAMAILWGAVDRILPGPLPMLVLQSTAFLIGLYVILRRALQPRVAALCACAVMLFPPVLVSMAVIWKDALMAGFLALGIAAQSAERRWIRVLGLGALMMATAMRYNALAATLPIVMMLFEWKRGQRWIARYAIAAAAWLAISAVALGINLAAADRKMYIWYSSLALTDIVGTLDHIEPDMPDDELRPLLAPTQVKIDHDFHAAIRAKYIPAEFSQLISGDSPLWRLPIAGTTPAPEPQRVAIGRAWSEIVGGHLGAYIRYRLDTFVECLGLARKFKGVTVMLHQWQTPELLASFGLRRTSWGFQDSIENTLLTLVKKTRLFRPHVYFFLSFALLAFCRRERDILAILLSGLVMELSLLPLAVTPDYRYSHWLVTCTCLAVVMLIARRMRLPTRDIARASE